MIKIIVDSEELKNQLIKESEYIHDFSELVDDEIVCLDSDMCNTLMHIYMNPDIIEVRNTESIQKNNIAGSVDDDWGWQSHLTRDY